MPLSVCVCARFFFVWRTIILQGTVPHCQLLSAISHVCDDANSDGDDARRIIICSGSRSLSLSFSITLSLLYARTPYALRSALCALCSLLSELYGVFSVFFSSTLGQCFDSHFCSTFSLSGCSSFFYIYQRSPIESIAFASTLSPSLLLSLSSTLL